MGKCAQERGPGNRGAEHEDEPGRLVPKDLHYYSFEGSLTTPPCTEGVAFYILKTPAALSKDQVQAFPFKVNARPVQPLNGREILAN